MSTSVGGAFLANTIPHLVNGISGLPFQSPFASPPGQGLSSSTVNVLWGKFNLALTRGLRSFQASREDDRESYFLPSMFYYTEVSCCFC